MAKFILNFIFPPDQRRFLLLKFQKGQMEQFAEQAESMSSLFIFGGWFVVGFQSCLVTETIMHILIQENIDNVLRNRQSGN